MWGRGKQTVATNVYSSGLCQATATSLWVFTRAKLANSRVHKERSYRTLNIIIRNLCVLIISGQLPLCLTLNIVSAYNLTCSFPDCPFFKVVRSHCWHHPWQCCPCRSGRVLHGHKMPAWSTAPPQNSLRCGRLE